MFELLKGKKTYILAGVLFVLGGAHALGWLSNDVYKTLAELLFPASIVALRASK